MLPWRARPSLSGVECPSLITIPSDLSSSVILVLSNTTASFLASILFVTVYVQNTSYRVCNHFHDLCLDVFRSSRFSVSTFKHEAKYGSRAAVVLFPFNKILGKSCMYPKVSYQTQFHCLDLGWFICLKFARSPYWCY
jgi:hypothetical protein